MATAWPPVFERLEGASRPARVLAVLTGIALGCYPLLNLVLEVLGVTTGPRLHDFGAYYNAADRLLNGYPLYEQTIDLPGISSPLGPEKGFLYPPIVVVPFLPFVVLPPVAAGVLWDLLSLGVLVWSVLRLLAAFDVDLTWWQAIGVCWLVLGYAPTITVLKAGQITGLLTALLCLALAELESATRTTAGATASGARRQYFSGVLTTLASIPKPYYATSGAHLLRNRRRFAAAVTTGMGAVTLSFLLFGIDTHLAYVDVLFSGSDRGAVRPPDTWNAGQFRPLHVLGGFAPVVTVAVIAGTIALTLASRRDDSPATDRLVFLLGTIAFLSVPSGVINTLALHTLLPVFVTLLVTESRRPDGRIGLVLAGLLLVQVHPYTVEFVAKFGPSVVPPVRRLIPALPLLQPALWGTVVTFGLVVTRLTGRLR